MHHRGRGLRRLAGAALALALACAAWALEPRNVAVVVNGDSWASRTVADAYVRLRGIPGRNVIVLRGLPHLQELGVEDFRRLVLGPVLAALRGRGPEDAIDCVAYAPDIPCDIDIPADLAGFTPAPYVGSRGSLTGLTFLHEAVMAGAARAYTALDANAYALRADAGAARPGPEDVEVLRRAGRALREGASEAARRELAALCDRRPDLAAAHYDLACALALSGEAEAALAALGRAAETGFLDAAHMEGDDDLASLRPLPGYADIRERVRRNQAGLRTPPPRPFRAAQAWGADGRPAAAGRRYLLSAVLAVTSGRGLSVREAVRCLERARAADGTRPAGTICYLRNWDVRSKAREWGFEAAAARLRELGVAAVVEKGTLPRDRADVAGLMAGVAEFDFPASGSRILPGAICEHLTSCGGMLAWGSVQTPLTEFLRHGAAGASGTVTEPYAIQAKFPDPFIHAHYAAGATLAEAFYQSVTGPYQLLVVGDPLCRPWGGGPPAAASGNALAAAPLAPLLPGAPLPAAAGFDPQASDRGLLATVDGRRLALSGDISGQSLWASLEAAPGANVRLEGFLEAAAGDDHQFQVHAEARPALVVDGRALEPAGGGPWWCFPAALARGWHAVTLELRVPAAGRPSWEPAFGAAGTRPLAPALRARPAAGAPVLHLGQALRTRVDGLDLAPFALRAAVALAGFEPSVAGAAALEWSAEEGWSVEPASARARLAAGASGNVAFAFRYRGEAGDAPGFFRFPRCAVRLETDAARPARVPPMALPVARMLAEAPRPRAVLPRLARPTVSDGRLDEAAWAAPATVARLLRPQLDRPAAQATAVWLAWDERGLHLAARCAEPDLARLKTAARARDGATWQDDALELFVSTDAGAADYRQFVVNAAGTLCDARGWDRAWNGEARVASGREAGAWTLELSVPWTDLGGRPGPGAVIRVLVARDRKAGGDDEVATWPFAAGGNHQPALFAEAVLGGI